MNLFTKLLELAWVIHESSSLPPLLFCGLTFTRLIESVLYKIWTQAHGFLFLNLFHAAYTFPQPAFIPFFSALHHNFPSNSQLTSTYCIICLKAKCYRMGEPNSYYFPRSMCQVINGRWVEVKSRSIFIFPFLCLSYTRRGSTCKLATKGEVENNYGSDAPGRNESIAWPVMKWKVDKPALCDSEIWMQGNDSSVQSTNRKRLPIISAGLLAAAWQAYWWLRMAVHV